MKAGAITREDRFPQLGHFSHTFTWPVSHRVYKLLTIWLRKFSKQNIFFHLVRSNVGLQVENFDALTFGEGRV